MRTDFPILVSLAEAAFQLSLPEEEIAAMVADGTLAAVEARGQTRVIYESLIAYARRAALQSGKKVAR